MNDFINNLIGDNYLLIPATLFIIGLLNIIFIYFKTAAWIKTRAKVKKVDSSQGSTRRNRDILYLSFVDKEGNTQNARLNVGAKAKNRWIKNGIRIIYKPSDPEKVEGASFGLCFRWTSVVWFIAILLTIGITLMEKGIL
jgi:hypothetical protein